MCLVNMFVDLNALCRYYNVSADPWQMDNLHKTSMPATIKQLHDKVHVWYKCAGDTCP